MSMEIWSLYTTGEFNSKQVVILAFVALFSALWIVLFFYGTFSRHKNLVMSAFPSIFRPGGVVFGQPITRFVVSSFFIPILHSVS